MTEAFYKTIFHITYRFIDRCDRKPVKYVKIDFGGKTNFSMLCI